MLLRIIRAGCTGASGAFITLRIGASGARTSGITGAIAGSIGWASTTGPIGVGTAAGAESGDMA